MEMGGRLDGTTVGRSVMKVETLRAIGVGGTIFLLVLFITAQVMGEELRPRILPQKPAALSRPPGESALWVKFRDDLKVRNWHERRTCPEVDCPRSNSIPTTSSWGLAVLTIALMIGGKIIFA